MAEDEISRTQGREKKRQEEDPKAVNYRRDIYGARNAYEGTDGVA